MSLKNVINMCRICKKTIDGMSIYSDKGIKKFQFCSLLEVLKSDDLPKSICNKCVGRLEVAYDFRKQSDFESEEISIMNIPHTLEEGINCKRTERLTDSVPVYAVVGEYSAADKVKIEEIEKTKQTNLFTIAKVTSIPKTEFNKTDEITGNKSCSQEDIGIGSLIGETQIKGEQMKQPTNVKPIKISETIVKGIQYKGSTGGADITKLEEIEKMQNTIFTITEVTSFRRNEGFQTYKFECIVCGARFTQKGSLKRHSHLHSSERPYNCNICGRGFTQSGGLTNHSRIHSVERPFKLKKIS